MLGSVVVDHVGKSFVRTRGGRGATLKEAVLSGFRQRSLDVFDSRHDVTFSVSAGRAVGIVGRNGSGKSTLLRLIGGVGRPTRGTIAVHGRVGALLDLGAGLTDDLTGRENIFISGVISGMTRDEVRERCDAIIAFAELPDFIEMPIRTYSAGMRMRLAFSVAVHTDPDILLIDEALAVGDVEFQRKCLERIAQIKERGCTIFLVSHEASQIHAICDEAVLLAHGRMVAHGPVAEVMELYEPDLASAGLGVAGAAKGDTSSASPDPDGHAGILDVRLQGGGVATASIVSGAGLRIEVDCELRRDLAGVKLAVTLLAPDGTACFDSNTEASGLVFPSMQGRYTLSLKIDRLDLMGGEYSLEVGLYPEGWGEPLDRVTRAGCLRVVGPRTGRGFMNPPLAWSGKPRA